MTLQPSLFKQKPLRCALAYTLSLLFIWQPMLLAAQPLTATHQSNGRPTVDQAANGVPVINIQNPNSNGLSHNFYNDFNVDSSGLILNNSKQLTQTQLGGYIEGNPNLSNGTASLILNEVISNNPSSLNGYIEVGGARADVVVANPNGISCNGCGFINTNHATLSTGQPIMHNGVLSGFDAQGGAISILGDGLNAANTSRFDIIARSVEIAGELHADTLNIVTGQQTVDRASLNTSDITTDANKPSFAIDSTALGGMYANRIRLIANEEGVGVRLDAPVAAQNGDLKLSANGNIAYTDLASTKDITIDAGEHAVSGTGTAVATGNVQVNAGSITNTGTLGGHQSLTLNAANIINDAGGALLSGADLVLSADTVINRLGDIYALGDIRINGRNGSTPAALVENRSGRIQAQGDLTIEAEELLNVRDVLEWDETLIEGSLAYQCTWCEGDTLNVNYTFTEHFFRTLDEATTGHSQIISGGDMALSGNLLVNETSDILAEQNMTLRFNDIENLGLHSGEYLLINRYVANGAHGSGHLWNVYAGVRPYNSRNYTGGATYFSDGEHEYEEYMYLRPDAENSNYDPDNLLRREDNVIHQNIGASIEHKETLDSTDILGANILAGGNLDTSGAAIVNGDFGHRQEGNAEDAVALGEGSQGGAVADFLNGVNGGLFSLADPSHPYLIETNPFFATTDGFLGSAHLLNRLSWDPDGTVRLLGDGFYEQQLIRQQIVDLTGRALLDPDYVDANHQYETLLDNGFYAAESLELAIGVTLTADQINALTTDIVWMVEQQVAGETVLVPQLYLSPQSAHLNSTLTGGQRGALIGAGGDLINNGGSIVNSGTLYSGQDTLFDLNENGLQNIDGNIIAENILHIKSEGDIENISGTMQGREVILDSVGDIVNQRWTVQRDYQHGDVKEWYTNIGDAAAIRGTDAVTLKSENDIMISGSKVSGGAVTLDANGNINIETVVNNTGRKGNYYGGTLSESRVRHISSDISSTISLIANAANDLTVIGSHLASDGDIKLSSGNDLIIASAANSDSYNFLARHDGETTHSIDRSVRHQGSTVNGQGNVTLESGNNLTVIASKLESAEDLSLMGAGDIRLLAQRDSDYRYRYAEDDKWYGSKIKTEKKYDETARVVELVAAGNVQINASTDQKTGGVITSDKAKGSVLLEGTSVRSGGDSLIYAGEDLFVTAARTQSFHEVETRREYSKGLAKGAMAAYGLASIVPASSQMMAALATSDITIKGDQGAGSRGTQLTRADFMSDGDTMLMSGDDTTLVAADLFLDNLYVQAGLNGEEGEGEIALIGAHESKESWAYDSSTSLGVDASGGKLSFAKQYEHREKESQRDFIGTNISSKGSTTLSSTGDMLLLGSTLNSNGTVRLISGGDISLLAGVSSRHSEVSDTEREFKIELTTTSSSIELFGGYEETRHTESQTQRNAIGTQIAASNIEISSADDITIVGGVLQASTVADAELGSTGNITLKSEGDITTLASISESMLEVMDETFRTGVAIGAQENVSAAVEAVANVDDQEGALNSGSAALQAIDSVQAAQSGGITASAGLVAEWSKQESEDSSQTANASLIHADNDLAFVSGGDQRHTGTQASAGNNLTVDAKGNVIIESAQNTTKHKDKSTNGSMNVGLGTEGGISVGVAGGYAKNSTENIQQANAHFTAGSQASLNTGGDLTLAGAVVSAADIDADVGGNLTVKSRQDTGSTRGESAQASGSVGVGSFSLSLSGSRTKGDSAWVNEQSGLLASNKVDIYVEDHTSVIGGVINSESGDLALDTNTLSYQNIQDYDRLKSVSAGIGVGISRGQDSPSGTAAEQSRMPDVTMNSVTAGYQNREREQITRATVGAGNIIVRGDNDGEKNSLSGLNRDMAIAQQITKDEDDSYNLYVSDTSLQAIGVRDRDTNKENSRLDQLKDTFNVGLIISEIGESSFAGIDDVDNAIIDGLTLGTATANAEGNRGFLNDGAVDGLAGQVGDGLLAAGQTIVNKDHDGDWRFFGLGAGNDSTKHYQRNQDARLKQEVIRTLLAKQAAGDELSKSDLVDLVNNLSDYDAGRAQDVLAEIISEISGLNLDVGFYDERGGLTALGSAFLNEDAKVAGLNVRELNIQDPRDYMSALAEEGYHASSNEDDYANLYGNRFGYLWDKQNRKEGRNTGGITSAEDWEASNADLISSNSNTFGGYTLDQIEFRQLDSAEVRAIRQYAPHMAELEGVSVADAERRMGQLLLGLVDEHTDRKMQQNREPLDPVALAYLSEALVEIGSRYRPETGTEVPTLPELEVSFVDTAASVRENLLTFHDNHADQYANRTMFGEQLLFPEYMNEPRSFYEEHFRPDLGVGDSLYAASASVAGNAFGAFDVADGIVGGFASLLRNRPSTSAIAIFEGTKATSYELQTFLYDPFDYIGDFYQSRQDADINAFLDRMEGFDFEVSRRSTATNLGLALSALDVLPVGRVTSLRRLDVPRESVTPDTPDINIYRVEYGNGDAIYHVDADTSLTLVTDGRITGPHPGRGKGLPSSTQPVGGRESGDHRGHLIPEGGVDSPVFVNVMENIISEAPASNLGLKKSLDLSASRIAAQNPSSEIRFISEPVRTVGETRPFAVTHYIVKDGEIVEAVSVLNK